MPVEIRLTSEQFPHYEQVLNKAKVAFDNRGLLIELAADNIEAIIDALKQAHMKSLVLKTKTVFHMERLYNLEQIIVKLEALSLFFYSKQLGGNADNDDSMVSLTEQKELAA
jgi:uncharacterized Fe-S center protein